MDGVEDDPALYEGSSASNLTRRSSIEKRGDRPFDANIGTGTLHFESLGYPSPQKLFEDAKAKKFNLKAHGFTFNSDVIDDYKVKDAYVAPKKNDIWVVEHVVELQTVKNFIQSATGTSTLKLAKTVPGKFFSDWWNKELDQAKYNSRTQPPIEQAVFKSDKRTLNNLIFQALGSSFNRGDFVLCEKSINSFKERVWSGSDPMDTDKFKTLAEDASIGGMKSVLFLTPLRTTLAVFEYLNHATVKEKLKSAVSDVKIELSNIKHLTGEDVDLASLWSEFLPKHLAGSLTKAKKWLDDQIKVAEDAYTKELSNLETKLKQAQADEKKDTQVEIKKKQDEVTKLKAEWKGLETKYDQAQKDVEDQKDKIANMPSSSTKAKKDAEKRILTKLEAAEYTALKNMNLKERQFETVWAQSIQQVIADTKKDQQVLAKFKAQVAKIAMPPTV